MFTIELLNKLFSSFMCIKIVENGESMMNTEDAVALLKGEGKILRRKERRIRIDQIRVTLGLSDSQRTPMVLTP